MKCDKCEEDHEEIYSDNGNDYYCSECYATVPLNPNDKTHF